MECVLVDSWKKLAHKHGFVHCATDEVDRAFHDIRKYRRPVILVTSESDGCVCRQEDHPANADLVKHLHSLDWNQQMLERRYYVGVQVGPAADTNRCRVNHEFAVKFDRFTQLTFDEIPDNIVRWYTTNLNMIHPKVRLIPYGINQQGHGKDIIDNYIGNLKDKLLYINFQPNSYERLQILRKLQAETPDWVTIENNVSVEDYYNQMSRHHFVLSPPGNGLDCYRNYEALTLGCVPILQNSEFARQLLQLPIKGIAIDNMVNLDESLWFSPASLRRLWSSCTTAANRLHITNEAISLQYWDNHFKAIKCSLYWDNHFQEID